MAGDWIKMRGNLWDDPRVGAIVDATESTEAAVIGALYWLWATADQHTEDGCMPGLTLRQIDRKTGVPGFAAAIVAIGWISESPTGIVIAKFEEHNGTSAKKRAVTAKRVANHRSGNADVTQPALQKGDASDTPALAREEKRREERKNTPLPPAGGCKRFEEFWTAWPKSDRKQDKVKCADKWRRGSLDLQAEAILADLDRRKGGRKWREADGQYIEAPLTYLNGKRWEDGADIESEAMETFL